MDRREFLKFLGIGAAVLILPVPYQDADPIEAPGVYYDRDNRRYWHCQFGEKAQTLLTFRKDDRQNVYAVDDLMLFAGTQYPIQMMLKRGMRGQPILNFASGINGIVRWKAPIDEAIIYQPKTTAVITIASFDDPKEFNAESLFFA